LWDQKQQLIKLKTDNCAYVKTIKEKSAEILKIDAELQARFECISSNLMVYENIQHFPLTKCMQTYDLVPTSLLCLAAGRLPI
jgi:hypothetical protein